MPRTTRSLFVVLLLAGAAHCKKSEAPTSATPADGGGGATASSASATSPSTACSGTCIVDWSPSDHGMGIDDGAVSSAVATCKSKHPGDERCDKNIWQAGRHVAECQICKQKVDVVAEKYAVTLEYKEKFGHVYWVYRSPTRDGQQTMYWVGAHDAVLKGPWTLPTGTDP